MAAIAWRMQGERGEALRDLLMHPRVRAYARAELDVLSVIPRALFMGGRPPAATYHRGTYGAALAFAFTPAVAAEGLVFHLILGGGAVLLASRRRVDVLLELSEPVRIQRPFQEPIETRTLAVASDDPDGLIRMLLAPAPGSADGWTLAWTVELATLARDAAQPG